MAIIGPRPLLIAPMNVLLYIIDYLERNPDYVDFWPICIE